MLGNALAANSSLSWGSTAPEPLLPTAGVPFLALSSPALACEPGDCLVLEATSVRFSSDA